MLLNPAWFPTNLPARAAWFANFTANFTNVAASLGLSSSVAQAEKDNAVIQFLADSFLQVRSYESAMGQYRRIITEGDIGDPEPAIPANPALVFPDAVATGIFERLNKLREKILAADAYTDGIGALLGILPSKSESISEGDVKPNITVDEAATGYLFSTTVKGRAESDSWEVWIMKKGGTWTRAGTFTGKSGDVTVVPTSPGDAEQIQVRVQLRKSNTNYGDPSDVVYTTVNP